MGGTSSFRRRDKKLSKKMQRSLDPAMLLARGLSARYVGANVSQHLTPLNKDEMEKDLRHMNAFYQANIAYAQQHYLYTNRDEIQAQQAAQAGGGSGAAAAGGAYYGGHGRAADGSIFVPPVAMPVRIDPEEEKRLQNLRKKIALCETQREFLEGQYVSLRAHYVSLSKQLTTATKHNQGQTAFVQSVTKRRAKVLALKRARLQMARDVLVCLQTRLERLEGATTTTGAAVVAKTTSDATTKKVETNHNNEKDDNKNDAAMNGGTIPMDTTDTTQSTGAAAVVSNSTTNNSAINQQKDDDLDDGDDDIIQIWNEMEEMLKEAELSCRNVTSTITITEKKPRKRSKKAAASAESEEESNVAVLPWEALKMPQTPPGVPLLLSQLALVPDKGAAFSKFEYVVCFRVCVLLLLWVVELSPFGTSVILLC